MGSYLWGFRTVRRVGFTLRSVDGEGQPDARAGLFRVLDCQFATVIFHDLLDDGQTQAGALAAGRNIGFHQTVAQLGGQATAVILDRYFHMITRLHDLDNDTAVAQASAAGLDAGGDGFGGVQQHIGQHLDDLLAVASQFNRVFGGVDGKFDLGMGNLLQGKRLTQKIVRVLALEDRRRHAGEGREFIDHAPDNADLTLDGFDAG